MPGASQRSDNGALIALGLAIAGLVLGLPLGVPGLICGPIAYFMGKAAINRIDASAGALSGRGMATAAWIFGIVATAVGAVITLVWLVLLLIQISGSPPQ
ncbi:MAG: DUF4190 domain-containing protein [Chloroflexi bacterium]|nr:MAG: DUF4190 domain-containing protein [Chloroflexota bacterium]